MGSTGLLNALFSSESLPDLVDFKEYFSVMVQHDHVIIQQYLAQISESNRAREEHAREKLRFMKLADELGEKEKELNDLKLKFADLEKTAKNFTAEIYSFISEYTFWTLYKQ